MEIAQAGADLTDKEIHFIDFAMSRDEGETPPGPPASGGGGARPAGPGDRRGHAGAGDVSLFASSAYVAQLLEEEGCRCVRVPGVPSFCAAAARLGRSLTEMDLPVHIVPAGGFPLEEALDLPGTKVLMKSGRALPQVLEALESRGLLESSAMVQNCGLPGEQAAESLKDAPQSGSYFTTLLVP